MHAQDRALQRYNQELSDEDIANISKIIKQNKQISLYSSEENKNMKFCYVVYNNIPYKILYLHTKRNIYIITVYPFDPDEYNEAIEEKEKNKIKSYIEFLESKGYKIIMTNKNEEDKWLLWSKEKSSDYGMDVFWAKDDCGYTANVNEVQIYTYDEAYKRSTLDDIPVKYSELISHVRTMFSNVYSVCSKAELDYINRNNGA